jgi:hypothetical protein
VVVDSRRGKYAEFIVTDSAAQDEQVPIVRKRLSLSLLANALDYLDHAVDAASRPDTVKRRKSLLYVRWKYAVLNVQAGIELLLKARLAQEHWSLIFANVDQATLDALLKGDVASVSLDVAIKRLQNIAHVSLGSEFERNGSLDKLRKLRNRLQHFQFAIEVDQFRSVVTEAPRWALDFYAAEFPSHPVDPGYDPGAAESAARVRQRLAALQRDS